MNLPTKVKVVDLTARDGLEGLKELVPVDFRVALIDRLTEAGFPATDLVSGLPRRSVIGWIPRFPSP